MSIPSAVLYTTLGILLVSTVTIAGSALLSVYSDAQEEEHYLQAQKKCKSTLSFSAPASHHEEVTWYQAIMFPVIASISLLSLFLFFSSLQYILFGILVTGAFGALYQLLHFLLEHFSYFSRLSSSMKNFAVGMVTGVVVVHWLMTGSWISHNILCISLTVLFIHTLRFPSLKIVALCLTLLLLYDAFWVFYSQFFFEKNVMVEVAMKSVSNPVRDVVSLMHAPASVITLFSSTVELPMKLIFPVSIEGRTVRWMMLGLGDIALPGAAVSFALRCDIALIRLSLKAQNSEDDEESHLLPENRSEIQNLAIHGNNSNVIADDEDIGVSMIATSENKTFNTKTSVNSPLSQQYAIISSLCRNCTEFKSFLFFSISVIAYSFGLLCAFAGNFLTRQAQPALIYIVPSILLAILGATVSTGHFEELWNGVDAYHKEKLAKNHRQ